jgi:putative tryptophan/tyrosine transport system substrate-binding protein
MEGSAAGRTRREILRDGLALAGLGALAGCGLRVPPWAPSARRLPRVGFLKQPPLLNYVDAFRDGMREYGYAEGENFILDYRYVEQASQLPDVAAELTRIPVDVLVCPNVAAVDAARRATGTIPIVFVTAANPVATGSVESLARPGGNLTGPSQLAPGLTGKRLEILRDLDPRISRVGVFWDPGQRNSVIQWQETQAAAATLGLELLSLEAREPGDFEAAFALALGGGAHALFMPIAQAIMVQLPLIAHFAVAHRLPSMAFQREFPDAGGLSSYGASIPALYRRAAYYVDRILRGAKPAELPVEQATVFDLILNLRTASALGLTLTESVLQQAAELIQ